MSIKVMTLVWEHSQHKGGDLLTLLAIADHADDHGSCFPSIDRLAHKSRVTRRHLFRILERLEKSKELSIEHNAGYRGTNRYTINLALLRGDKKTGDKKTRVTKRQVTSAAPKCHPNHQEPSSYSSNLKKDSQKNPPVSPLKKSKRKKPQTTIPEPFVITDGNRAWFEREFPAYDCDKTTERWVDEMRSKAIERAEWNAAYRAMIPKTVEWKGVRKPLAKGEIF